MTGMGHMVVLHRSTQQARLAVLAALAGEDVGVMPLRVCVRPSGIKMDPTAQLLTWVSGLFFHPDSPFVKCFYSSELKKYTAMRQKKYQTKRLFEIDYNHI